MNTSNMKGHLNGLIATLKESEKITKVTLSILSRDMLLYVPDTDDIDMVNRTLSVLTPMNKATAILFFTHFLPWEAERDSDDKFTRFGKKSKGDKRLAKSVDAIKAFLADPSNDIWSWAAENVQTELKKKDLAGAIHRSVVQALKGDEKTDTPPLNPAAVMAAVFGGGITLEQMLEAADAFEQQQQAELEAAEAIMQQSLDAAAQLAEAVDNVQEQAKEFEPAH